MHRFRAAAKQMLTHHTHKRRTTAKFAGPIAFFAFGLTATAQPGTTNQPRGVSQPVAAQAGEVSGAVERAVVDPAVVGTPAQLLERGKAALEEISIARTSLTELVSAAKDQRDVVKVLCLDDKSGQVDAALRTTEERVESLAIAAKHGADERARHEYLMVVTLKERVTVLMSEANQCLGEETGFTGDSVLNVEIDPNLPRVIAEVVPFSPVLFIPVSLNSGVY
jgi:hypothetical protein